MQPESSAARICGQQRQRIRGKASKTGFPGRARKTEKMPSQRGGTLSNHLVPHIHTLDLAGKNAPAARGHPLKPSCTSHSCSRFCRQKCPPQRGGTPSNHLVPHIHALDLAGKNAPAARGHPLKPSCTSHSCSRSCRQKCPPQRGGTLSNPLVPHIHTLDLAGDVGVVDQGAAKIVAVFGKGDIHPRG